MKLFSILAVFAAPATVSASYYCVEEQCATDLPWSSGDGTPPLFHVCQLAFDGVVHEAYTGTHDVTMILESCRSYCVEGSRAQYWDGQAGSLWEMCGSCHDPEVRDTMCNTFCADTETPTFCDQPPVVTEHCTFEAGDAMGGSELRLGVAATPAACVDMVLAAHPDADGVTYGASSSCYAEWDITDITHVIAGYRTCIFETRSPQAAPTTAPPVADPPTAPDTIVTDSPVDQTDQTDQTDPPVDLVDPVDLTDPPPTVDTTDGAGSGSGAGDRVDGIGNVDLLGKNRGHNQLLPSGGKSPRPDRPLHILDVDLTGEGKGAKGAGGKKGDLSVSRVTQLEAGAGSAALIALVSLAVFGAYRKRKHRIQHLDDIEAELATVGFDNNDGGRLGRGALDHEGQGELDRTDETVPLLQEQLPAIV